MMEGTPFWIWEAYFFGATWFRGGILGANELQQRSQILKHFGDENLKPSQLGESFVKEATHYIKKKRYVWIWNPSPECQLAKVGLLDGLGCYSPT